MFFVALFVIAKCPIIDEWIRKYLYTKTLIKYMKQDQNNSAVGRELALHMANTGSIPVIPYGLLSIAKSNSWMRSEE